MNERTHFFLKIYLSHIILKRVDVGCVWEMSWRRGQTAILTQQYFFLILAGLLNRWSLSAQSPLSTAGSQFGILAPTASNCLALVILLFNVHLLPLFFLLIYTCAYLEWRLGRGSIYYIYTSPG